MSIHPGYSGQLFMPDSLDRIAVGGIEEYQSRHAIRVPPRKQFRREPANRRGDHDIWRWNRRVREQTVEIVDQNTGRHHWLTGIAPARPRAVVRTYLRPSRDFRARLV